MREQESREGQVELTRWHRVGGVGKARVNVCKLLGRGFLSQMSSFVSSISVPSTLPAGPTIRARS
jgi:hypothetical protein